MLVAVCWKQTGYVMLLYLAGLKAVDPTLREAATVDGASETQTFFRVVFPVMRPINVVVLVITFIEGLRAFDIVWVINKGRNGLELISALVTQNIVGEASRIGFGSALATIMLAISSVFVAHLRTDRAARGGQQHERHRRAHRDDDRRADPGRSAGDRRPRGRRVLLHAFLSVVAVLWLFPIGYALLSSFRTYAYTQEHGYLSFGGFTRRQLQGRLGAGRLHPATSSTPSTSPVPAVLLTLFLSSCMAFVLARFSFKFNLTLLGVFLAANLLPQQALLIPLFRMFREIPLPTFMSDSGTMLNSFWALILVNTAFQTGFCTFVLSNYMKTLPKELYESAQVDGASVLRQFFQLTLPLCRPPLAALATLEVTWIYNEFFWATVLLQSGDKFPITSSLNNLRGEFFTDNNLVAAGSMVVALPPLIIFFILQKQFVSGLTLGATKG